MLAFHNDPAVKAKYIQRVRDHMETDEIVRGATGQNGKGCAVWCTLDAYDHSRYPVELGIPEWLARLEDEMFDNMSVGKSRTWPLDFLSAAQLGADLDKIKGPFLVVILRRVLTRFDHAAHPDVVAVVERSIALWQRADVGSDAWNEEAQAARATAWKAMWTEMPREARAVAQVAGAAAAVMWTEVVWTTWAAARAAAARAAEYDYFADELLRLMSEAA